jgi:neprilysin
LTQLDQASLGLSREYLIKGKEDKVVTAYYEYMVDLAVLYGAERTRAESELMESLKFEMALANVRGLKVQKSARKWHFFIYH